MTTLLNGLDDAGNVTPLHLDDLGDAGEESVQIATGKDRAEVEARVQAALRGAIRPDAADTGAPADALPAFSVKCDRCLVLDEPTLNRVVAMEACIRHWRVTGHACEILVHAQGAKS